MSDAPPPTTPFVLRARHCAGLALGYIVFIIYGSLVPFHFRRLSLSEALHEYHEAYLHFRPVDSPSDFLANVLLFMPLGFLLMAVLCLDRRRWWALPAALVVLPACTAFSMAVEFTQLYFPPRDTSFADVFANFLGASIGVATWLLLGPAMVRWWRAVWTSQFGFGVASLLLPAYLLFLAALNLLPLELTLSPVEIYHKYRRGMISLVPYAALPGVDVYYRIEHHLWILAYFFPVGLLLAFLPAASWRDASRWPRVLGIGVLLTGVLESIKLFVLTRFFDVSDMVTGTAAILAGWAAGVHLATRRKAGLAAAPGYAGVLFGLGWLAAVLFVEWHPFRFEPTPRWPESWLPFVDYVEQHNYFQPLDQIVRKTMLFLPGGVLWALCLPAAGRRFPTAELVWNAFAIAVAVEVGQLFLPGRYFSVTDILVETGGAWLGYVAARRARRLATAWPAQEPGA